MSSLPPPAPDAQPPVASSSHLFALDVEHVATTTDDWYTPAWVFKAADMKFSMDVAAPIDPMSRTVPAWQHLTILDDGLTSAWEGTVWCNPPYSKATPWVDRWAAHPHGLILLPSVRSPWMGDLLAAADALTLLNIEFLRPDGRTASLMWPNILAARGGPCVEALGRIARADRYARGGYLVRDEKGAA